jgi:hypothetical protein
VAGINARPCNVHMHMQRHEGGPAAATQQPGGTSRLAGCVKKYHGPRSTSTARMRHVTHACNKAQQGNAKASTPRHITNITASSCQGRMAMGLGLSAISETRSGGKMTSCSYSNERPAASRCCSNKTTCALSCCLRSQEQGASVGWSGPASGLFQGPRPKARELELELRIRAAYIFHVCHMSVE